MSEVQMIKRSPAEQSLSQRRAKESMRSQVAMFSLMIFLTLVSFSMVFAHLNDVPGFSKFFIIPTLFLFAAVQVGLQLYYFMHMNEKGHGIPQMFMFTGAMLGFLLPLTFVTIVWW
ncbi:MULTISPECIES: cytochrome C oxidase subunit IV family protein [Sporosarcina]|uniref:Cytochrome B6 n=1 Tax=Sporosarcina ureae TaxID=1571 RepID=A0ABM6JYD5_SPOUR|nr:MULTISPECIES: cytochrome C oxidase subunit IV family protein [Sporosarcina]ARF15213.1 cytochrome B6 [Sporosarcina ureae]PIC78137.1 cytochrome B6 [Sporosarcina sp. P19]